MYGKQTTFCCQLKKFTLSSWKQIPYRKEKYLVKQKNILLQMRIVKSLNVVVFCFFFKPKSHHGDPTASREKLFLSHSLFSSTIGLFWNIFSPSSAGELAFPAKGPPAVFSRRSQPHGADVQVNPQLDLLGLAHLWSRSTRSSRRSTGLLCQGKHAQLIPQTATRSTSVNLYSSLTTGSIFLFIQPVRHLTRGLSTSSYKRLKSKDQKHIRYKLRDALSVETVYYSGAFK